MHFHTHCEQVPRVLGTRVGFGCPVHENVPPYIIRQGKAKALGLCQDLSHDMLGRLARAILPSTKVLQLATSNNLNDMAIRDDARSKPGGRWIIRHGEYISESPASFDQREISTAVGDGTMSIRQCAGPLFLGCLEKRML
jgi:hypothetical protein